MRLMRTRTRGTVRELAIRAAVEGDAQAIHDLFRELAEYEGLSHRMTVTADTLREDLFAKARARAFIGEWVSPTERRATAVAVVCERYSTFAGKRILFLEDIFVRERDRSEGVGGKLFDFIAETARREGFIRVEWSVLSWNEGAKGFYRSKGGKPVTDWESWEREI